MIASAAATAARAVSNRTAPAMVGAFRNFWADVPMAPKVLRDDRFSCRRRCDNAFSRFSSSRHGPHARVS